MINYIEALAIVRGDAIKERIWQVLLSLWAFMLVCGMAQINPPLLPIFICQSVVLTVIIVIDSYTSEPTKELILVWFLMIIAACDQAKEL